MRVKILSIIIFVSFGLLFVGLAYIQVVRGPYYLRKSSSNRIRLESLEAPRGRILDRNDVLLVGNRISFDVAVIPQELENQGKTFSRLSKILGVPLNQIQNSFNPNFTAPFAPAVIQVDIKKTTAIRLEEARLELPGVMLQTRPLRDYIYDHVGSHIFGHLGRINKEELARLQNYGYQRQDLMGRSGLEKYFGNYLKGEDGGVQLEVNNRGRQLRMLGIKEAVSGKDIYLTIDIKLQKFIDDLLSPYRGAAIVIDPRDGQILSLVSKPNFDPNLFVAKSNPSAVRELLKRTDYPMVNRAVSGRYPPGSIFKVVIAAAALEKKKIKAQTRLDCKGSYAVGNKVFRCWKKKGHGTQDITEGIKNSCNVFFYQLGRIAGSDNIADFARRFGYGNHSGIDLTNEVPGLVPSRLWKIMTKREPWFEGDTVNFSIGQGYLLVTPIQVLRMMAAVANGGNLVQPYLVRRIDYIDVSSPEPRSMKISSGTIESIKKGLRKVVNDSDGTGRRAKVAGLLIAGKTGTAQTGSKKTHAWFSGFSPMDKARVCVLVFLEHGGKGGLNASEIAGKIFEELKREGYL